MSKAKSIYGNARENGIYLEFTCAQIPEYKWDELYENATRANKKIVNKIVRDAGYCDGWLTNRRNPYEYFKTKTHLILVHSATDYFFKIN